MKMTLYQDILVWACYTSSVKTPCMGDVAYECMSCMYCSNQKACIDIPITVLYNCHLYSNMWNTLSEHNIINMPYICFSHEHTLLEITDGKVVRVGVSVTWNVLSWSGGHEFAPGLVELGVLGSSVLSPTWIKINICWHATRQLCRLCHTTCDSYLTVHFNLCYCMLYFQKINTWAGSTWHFTRDLFSDVSMMVKHARCDSGTLSANFPSDVVMLYITDPQGRLKWSSAIIKLTAHFNCGLMSLLVISKLRKSMVMHDAKCPHWDQASLNNKQRKLWFNLPLLHFCMSSRRYTQKLIT